MKNLHISKAGAEGFEPTLTVLETVILPLEDTPKMIKHKNQD